MKGYLVTHPVSRRTEREKFRRVGDPLEADDIRAEKSLDDLGSPRELRIDPVRREGDVVEEPDRQVGSDEPQHPRHQLHLVVLHPDRRALARDGGGRVRESLVHGHIVFPPLTVVAGATR